MISGKRWPKKKDQEQEYLNLGRVFRAHHWNVFDCILHFFAQAPAFFSLFGLVYAFIGVFLMSAGDRLAQSNQPPPPFVGLLFGLLGFGCGGLPGGRHG